MATYIQVNGRFIIPTQENLEKMNNAKLPKEAISKTALPLDAEIEVVGIETEKLQEEKQVSNVDETPKIDDNSDLSMLRSQYEAKTGKKAFNGRNAEKLKEKLAE